MVGLFSKSNKASDEAMKIDGLLRELYGDSFHFDGENFWMGVEGSTVITVLHLTHSGQAASIHINAHVIRNVTVTPSLCMDLLTNPEYQFTIGRWSIEKENEGQGLVLLGVDLVSMEGSVDQAELGAAIGLLAETADGIDDALAAKYGGKTAVDALRQ